MSLYRKIFKDSWQITKRYKYLWFFGLFAVFLGNGGEYEILTLALSGKEAVIFPGVQVIAATKIFTWTSLSNIGQLLAAQPLALMILMAIWLFILTIFLFIIWLSVTSQIALVNNTALIGAKKNQSFQTGVNAGSKNFWPVFILNVFLRIFIYVAFIIISLPIILSTISGSLTLSLMQLIFYIIFIPLTVAFSFVIRYAISYLVIKQNSFVNSLSNGWKLFKKNWLITLEMGIILLGVYFVAAIILALAFFVLLIPFYLLAILFFKLFYALGFILVFVFALIIAFGSIVLVGSILSSFQVVAWTNLFIELVSKGGVSKLVRIFETGKKN